VYAQKFYRERLGERKVILVTSIHIDFLGLRKMAQKPRTAFILSLIGVFILLGGLALGGLGTLIALEEFYAGFLLWLFPIFGLVIIIGASLFNSYPSFAKTWGIVILILGIISLIGIVTALGGILSIIGGALAITWKHSAGRTPPP